MGLPVAKLICASNENKVLYDFFETGKYDKNREFILTSSPSMDILISSNLERLIYWAAGNDAKKNVEFMTALTKEGVYEITPQMQEKLKDFYGNYASEEETAEAIRTLYEKTGYILDTHTAVAASVYGKYKAETKDDQTTTVIASTASPYKFVKSVMSAIDAENANADEFDLLPKLQEVSGVPMPQAIKDILDAKVLHDLECDADKMKDMVKGILGV